MKNTALVLLLICALLFSSVELVKMAKANAEPILWTMFYSNYDEVGQVPSTIPPSISIYSPQNNTVYSSRNITVSLYVRNAKLAGWQSSVIDVYYTLDGKSGAGLYFHPINERLPTFDTTFNLSFVSLGEHQLTVEAYVDVLRSAPKEVFFLETTSTVYFTVVDVTAPVILNLSIENKTYSQNDLSLYCAVDELTSWKGYSLDEQANVTMTKNFTPIKIASGPHTLTVYANDTSGNMGCSETVYFTLEEPFPTSFAVASVIVVVVVLVGIGLLLYGIKRKR